jgi:hypothetical protein
MTVRTRTIYQLTLAATGSDWNPIHALRATLKFAARRGLRALATRELPSPETPARSRRSADGWQAKQRLKAKAMDMRKFRKAKFLKVEDCRQPQQMRIAGVTVGQFDKPDVFFENGDRLGLSATNVDVLTDAYGWESDGWIGHVVELYVDKGTFKGDPVDMVMLRPISKVEGEETVPTPEKKAPNRPPQLAKPVSTDMDDTIPF